MRELLTGDPGHANKKHPSLRLAVRPQTRVVIYSNLRPRQVRGRSNLYLSSLKEQIPIPQGFCCWTHCGGPFTSTKRLFPSFVTLKARPGMKVLAILWCAR